MTATAATTTSTEETIRYAGAVLRTATRPPLKTRLATLLDYMVLATYPPDHCGNCLTSPAGLCEECTTHSDDFAVINTALARIEQAPDDRTALAVYMKTVMQLTGIFPGSAAVIGATNGGEN